VNENLVIEERVARENARRGVSPGEKAQDENAETLLNEVSSLFNVLRPYDSTKAFQVLF